MSPLPWLIYTRVSTEDQAQGGVSLDAQLTSCRAYAIAKGWTVAEEITDAGASATTLKREGMTKVIAALKGRKVAGVIAWRLDRITRSMRDLLHLLEMANDLDVGLVSVSESLDTTTPMGRFVVHLLGAIAQWESETIGQRTKTAMDHARRQGYWMGRSIPAGCEVVIEGARKKLVRSSEAEAVAAAWPMILAGKSLRDVSEKFKADSVRPSLNGSGVAATWTPASVRHLLLSAQVCGLLVDPATQATVRKVLQDRQSPGRRGKAKAPGAKAIEPSPLAGLLRCPTCDAAMVQVGATGAGGTLYRYFRCTARIRGTCPQKDERAEPIEAEVIAGVQSAIQEGSEFVNGIRAMYEAARNTREAAKAERLTLTAERDQLAARVTAVTLETQVGGTVWREAMRGLGTELERLDHRLAELQGIEAAGSVDADNLDNAISGIIQEAGNLPNLPLPQQVIILRGIVSRVRLTPEEVILELYQPSGVECRSSYNAMKYRPRRDSNTRPPV